ncbi:MAG: hypothetical protein LBK68_03805 [Candidatus Margulisbacteria bacterium]|nr:hypothetical protein [Candidatus Margulisiibacteriota bacterium]
MAGNYTDSFAGNPYYILKGEQLSAAGVNAALNTKEKVANKQLYSTDTAATLTASSASDSYYPTSKLVGKNLDTLSTTISTGLSVVTTSLNGKQDKIGAGTAKNIVAYSGTAGTFDTLTRAATIMETDTTKASDDKIPTEKAVATALGGKLAASDLTTLNTKVDTLETTVASLQKLLPVGTILMFNAAGWQDNVTMAGWYKCVEANKSWGVPNLESRFIMGSTTFGQTGGSDSVTLTKENLPKHAHTITDPKHKHSVSAYAGDDGGSGQLVGGNSDGSVSDATVNTGTAGTDITVNDTFSSTQTEYARAFSIVPSYYAVIYVMKVN